jgi:precorrin-4/cobalt-precorrin-4 C11-methyltransferase
MTGSPNHPILFVGAGPGDPDLITVAGRNALEEADLIVYAGSLVPARMLDWARPEARKVDSSGLDLDRIVDMMVQAYRAGEKAVRLHTGDPSLYGATAEQFSRLRASGVLYRVIPGVTAAFAAAAALGLEYTLPETTQTLILTRAAGRTPVPERETLTALAGHQASLAIYLSAGQAEDVSAALVQGYGPDAPVAVVYRVSWPDQRILWTTAQNLPRDLETAGLTRQVLILAGRPLQRLRNEEASPASRLYDACFSHGFRAGRTS